MVNRKNAKTFYIKIVVKNLVFFSNEKDLKTCVSKIFPSFLAILTLR